jgi:hypothetical protein
MAIFYSLKGASPKNIVRSFYPFSRMSSRDFTGDSAAAAAAAV